jgi:phosphohistidine phosphatase
MDIFVVRHADAGKRMKRGVSDAARGLTAEGKRDAEVLASLIRKAGIKADSLLSSELKRAKETAEIIASGSGQKAPIQHWKELNPESTPEQLLLRISSLRHDSTLLLVGHNPFLQSLIAAVIANGEECAVDLKKCAIARIEVRTFSPSPRGELKWLLTPKMQRLASRPDE